MRFFVFAAAGLLGSLGFVGGEAAFFPLQGTSPPKIAWKKTVIEARFRSEGVNVADINRDGKLDIVAGDIWYEAPHWKMHEIRPLRDLGNGEKGYSECMTCFIEDVNKDGWPDMIVIGFPGKECFWYENPKNQPGHWKQRVVWRSACNETPLHTDLFGDGRKVLVFAIQPEGQMCWFEPGEDVEKPWEMHAISLPKSPHTERFSHGLGVGDINGDGRNDVITPAGWWEQPPQGRRHQDPWKFHPCKLGDPCADMYAFDVDGDGRNDVISSSAHRRGIWWHRRLPDTDGQCVFQKYDIFTEVTQTHALVLTDITGDGRPELITGKRWWAHGPKGDEDPNGTPYIFWFEILTPRSGPPRFVPHMVDDDSGIGTQFVVTDVNGDGLKDIVTANKRGVFLFTQVRGGK